MSSNLYEILGIKHDATPEEVRKAYRRKALETHPDRLPQNVTTAEKSAAEEQFRLVNNAYEVLNNAENRQLYDKHGVWPPPSEPRGDFGHQPSTFGDDPFSFANDPFFRSPFGNARPFHFTDPFVLFNTLFGDLHAAFDNDPFFAGTPFQRSPFDDPFFRSGPFGRSGGPFGQSPFSGMHDPFGGPMFGGSPFGGLLGGPMFPGIEGMPAGASTRMYSSSTAAIGNNGQWISKSEMKRTINGRTEVITKRVDANGNEHVTYSSPDGVRHTLNGVDQPNGAIDAPRHSESNGHPRQLPAIAGRPYPLASGFVPPQPVAEPMQSHVPIPSGSHHGHTRDQQQPRSPPAVVPPRPEDVYADRRSSHHSHRDRAPPVEPRRSHTLPVSRHNSSEHERRHSSHVPPAVNSQTRPANAYAPAPYPVPNDPRVRDYAYSNAVPPPAQDGSSSRIHHRHSSRRTTDREMERDRLRGGRGGMDGGDRLQQQGQQQQRGWRGW